jgi:hypothetical protein
MKKFIPVEAVKRMAVSTKNVNAHVPQETCFCISFQILIGAIFIPERTPLMSIVTCRAGNIADWRLLTVFSIYRRLVLLTGANIYQKERARHGGMGHHFCALLSGS